MSAADRIPPDRNPQTATAMRQSREGDVPQSPEVRTAPALPDEEDDAVLAAIAAVTDDVPGAAPNGDGDEGHAGQAPPDGQDLLKALPDFKAADAASSASDQSGSWRGIRRADGAVSAVRLLAELALDPLLKPTLRRALRAGSPVVVLVTVPSPAWVAPVKEVLFDASAYRIRFIAKASRPRVSANMDPDGEASELLAEHRPVVGIAPDASWVSPVLCAAADHSLDVPPLDAVLVTKAVALWCGRRARKRVAPADLAGLDILDVAAALRPGARPVECVARLRRASLARVGLPEGEAETPLAELTGFGPAHDWAMRLVADIDRVRQGEMKAGLLEGAVFYGIPGTGKTTLAKAIASAAGVPFVMTSVGDWFASSTGHLDGVIKAAASFFDALGVAAKVTGTAIGFADELDALPNRARLSDRGADWWLPVITYCLIRIEALRRSGIVLLAATNDLSRVDAALLRPGRFDRQFEISPPDEAARAGILRAHLGSDLAETDLTPLARLTDGMTGAVLAGGVRAARRRAQAAARALVLDDLLAELAPADARSPGQQRAAALHEAGHAVLAHRLDLAVQQVTIQAGVGYGGTTSIRFTDPTPDRAEMERRVVMLLAGRAADVVLGAGATAGASTDLREATRLLAALHASLGLGATLRAVVKEADAADLLREDPAFAALVEGDLQRLWRAAQARVAADRDAILALVEALLRTRVVTGAEVAALCVAHPPRVRVRAAQGRPAAPASPSPGLPPSG